MKDSILFVGGNWDLSGGKKSSIVSKFSKYLDNVTIYNGGNYHDLNNILESCVNYDIVIWWANVDNNLPKIRNVKDINYKAMLVSSKRNIDNKYSFMELVQRSLLLKSNLTVEFSNIESNYNMKLFDPLGNIWYDGEELEKCAKELINRLNFIKNITRKSTIKKENNDLFNSYFDIFKSKESNPEYISEIELKKEFLNIVREYAKTFSQAIFNEKDVKRFLGNASFRCTKGFPSFRDGKYIFVSKRNVNKEYISIDEFVPVYLEDDRIYYYGDNKPSVDTPIQVTIYDKLPNINYMIHSHCYIKGAKMTKNALPCGAIEEVKEIFNLIDKEYNSDYSRDFYTINLKGHGSIMMSKNPKQLANIEMIGRTLPENMYIKKLMK